MWVRMGSAEKSFQIIEKQMNFSKYFTIINTLKSIVLAKRRWYERSVWPPKPIQSSFRTFPIFRNHSGLDGVGSDVVGRRKMPRFEMVTENAQLLRSTKIRINCCWSVKSIILLVCARELESHNDCTVYKKGWLFWRHTYFWSLIRNQCT